MKIILGLSERDVRTIRELRIIANLNCREYEDKEETNWHDDSEFEKWTSRYELFNKLEALINNQVAMDTSINMNMQEYNKESPIWLCYGDIPVHPVHVEELTSVRKVAKQYGFDKEEDLGFLKFKILPNA